MNAKFSGREANKRNGKIVIVGGGSARSLSVAMQREPCQIVVVESDKIGIVGVGEFVNKTQARFKFAIEFADWRCIGHVTVAGTRSGYSSWSQY